MSLAKPWMLGSPPPVTSHCVLGAPVFWFSQTMGFDPQVPCARTLGPCRGATPASANNAADADRRRVRTIVDRLLDMGVEVERLKQHSRQQRALRNPLQGSIDASNRAVWRRKRRVLSPLEQTFSARLHRHAAGFGRVLSISKRGLGG